MRQTIVTLGRFAPGGEEHYARYAEGVLPLLQRFGARPRERLRGTETLVGETAPDLVAVIDFPDATAMHAFLSSPDYAACVPHRQQAFSWLVTFACKSF